MEINSTRKHIRLEKFRGSNTRVTAEMILKLSSAELTPLLGVINDAAMVYRGVIPDDRWKEPYMSASELSGEVTGGVQFYGWVEGKSLLGAMGIQQVKDVTLIRHAYVLTDHQRRGIGKKLLKHLLGLAPTPEILVGTWRAAWWAIGFYQKHGFTLTSKREGEALLREYWNIPERQVETSVVLIFQRRQLFVLFPRVQLACSTSR